MANLCVADVHAVAEGVHSVKDHAAWLGRLSIEIDSLLECDIDWEYASDQIDREDADSVFSIVHGLAAEIGWLLFH